MNQIRIDDYWLKPTIGGCGGKDACCYGCLYWWSGRCPYGGCYDDLRARIYPREKTTGEHWSGWSNCEKPGEQDHWGRGGICHPANVETVCPSYVKYEEEKHMIRRCLYAAVSVFQDGYIDCSLVESMGCEECCRRFEQEQEDE